MKIKIKEERLFSDSPEVFENALKQFTILMGIGDSQEAAVRLSPIMLQIMDGFGIGPIAKNEDDCSGCPGKQGDAIPKILSFLNIRSKTSPERDIQETMITKEAEESLRNSYYQENTIKSTTELGNIRSSRHSQLPLQSNRRTLLFHEMGHDQDGEKAGASIELFLKEGLKCKALLRQEGKLAPVELPHSGFYLPGFKGHREENVFFGYKEHPSCNANWVAIEVSEDADLHDAYFRDRCLPDKWDSTSVKIAEYRELRAKNLLPPEWWTPYNEHLIPHSVSPDKVIAYAKIEAELPFKAVRITDEQLLYVKTFVHDCLKFATHFQDAADNVLLYEYEQRGKYQIRISLNKAKVAGREHDVSAFFHQFEFMDELVAAALEFVQPNAEHNTFKHG